MTDLNLTQQPKQYSVLLIGENCDDVYKMVDIIKLSPEAPIPVVKESKEFTIRGMAANVKKNLESLGITEIDFITNGRTITKTRYLDSRSGYQLLRIDNDGLPAPWSGRLTEDLSNYDAVVISDYNKGFLTYEQIEKIMISAKCPIFIDTKKQDLARFSADQTFVKINELEYNSRSSVPKNLIVTMGHRGAWLKNLDTEKVFTTKSVDVIDVCGAGDTFLAALCVQYLYTGCIEKSIMFANTAAGLTVQHRGNYSPSYDEISRAGY